MVVDFTGLPDKLKAYSMGNMTSILTQLMIDGLSFLNYATLIIGNDEVPLMEMMTGEMLQPGGKDTFDPKGKFEFKSRIGKVKPCKVDLTFQQSDLIRIWKSYLGQIAKSASKGDVYSIPFENFFMQQIISKTKEDLHLKAAFKGKYDKTSKAAAAVMDGYLTVLESMVANGEIAPAQIFAGAPVTSVNAIDQFKGVKKLVPDAYRDQTLICLAAPSLIENYFEDYQTTHGSLPYNTEYKKNTLEGSNIIFQPEVGMSGSNRIIITPEKNIFWLADTLAGMDSIIIEKEKRNIHVLMDFECSSEFGTGGLIWTNDQQ